MHYFSKHTSKKMALLSRHDLQPKAAIKRPCSQQVILFTLKMKAYFAYFLLY